MGTPFYIIPPREITAGSTESGVISLNGLQGNINLGVQAGSGLFIVPSGSTLTFGLSGELGLGTGYLPLYGGTLAGNLQFNPTNPNDYGLRLLVNESMSLPSNGVEGSLIWDHATGMRIFDGTQWDTVVTATTAGAYLLLTGANGPITGSLGINNNFTVGGSTALSGTLGVTGNANFSNTLTSGALSSTTIAASGLISANNGLQIAAGKALYLGTAATDPGTGTAGEIYYNTTSSTIRIYTTGWGSLTGGSGISGSGTTNAIPLWSGSGSLSNSILSQSSGNLVLNTNPTTSANLSLIEIGSNGFAGGGTNFTGSSSGTYLGVNAPSGFTGNFLDLQSNGVSQISATSVGNLIANKFNNLTLASRLSGFAITGGADPCTFAISGANITLNSGTASSVYVPASGTLMTTLPSVTQSVLSSGIFVPLTIQGGSGHIFDLYNTGQTVGSSTPVIGIDTTGNLVLSPISGGYGIRAGNIATASLPVANVSNIGAIAWDTTAGALKVSNGSTWTIIGSGGGGSGTVNSGTTGQIAYYASNGTAVSGENTLASSQMPGLTGDVVSVSGTTSTTVEGIQGIPVSSTPPVIGETLVYNSATSNYIPSIYPLPGFGYSAGMVDCVATSNSVISGIGNTYDGYTPGPGDTILLTNQITATQNGPYIVGSGAWTRLPSYPSGATFLSGVYVLYIRSGAIYKGSMWISCVQNTITIGTNAMTWTEFSNVSSITGLPTDYISGYVPYYISNTSIGVGSGTAYNPNISAIQTSTIPLIYSYSPGSFTDLVVDAANNKKVTSNSYIFSQIDVSQTCDITSGTGFTIGTPQILYVSGGAAFLNAPAGTVGSTGGHFTLELTPSVLYGIFLVG